MNGKDEGKNELKNELGKWIEEILFLAVSAWQGCGAVGVVRVEGCDG